MLRVHVPCLNMSRISESPGSSSILFTCVIQKLVILYKMPTFGLLWAADQNSFMERAGKQLQMVLELTVVLWLISVTSSSLHSFQITTDGEVGSPWKTMTGRWKAVPSADVHDFGGTVSGRVPARHLIAAHFSILVHVCLQSSDIKIKNKKPATLFKRLSRWGFFPGLSL